ncbi:ADP-ribosyltransferase-containing protein [Herminiimonas contaminans]|uniref:Large polyvalent protein associated domain-containing protein n=1 Tax=Herminiimonas contaminans TaxID=1111140 RepID=A0ABS0ESI6_9BURK|nr:hypothetical protein [Herminiimonas contaminans]MBF8177803.1 hypothetical protein [Herminiimonas contaminans]
MPNDNPYLPLVQADTQQTLQGAFQAAADKNPDVEAKLQRLAAKAGVPLEAARLDQSSLERQVALQDIDYKTLAEKYPSTSALLSDPNTAALAKDDVKTISALEDTMNFGANSLRSFASGLPTFNEGFYGVLQAGADITASAISPLVGESPDTNMFAYLSGLASGQRKVSKAVGDAWRGDQAGMGFIQKSALSGFQSLGTSLLTAPAAVLSGNPAPMLYAMAGQTGGQAYGEARDKGKSVGTSLNYGASQAAIEFATERLPAAFLLRDIGLKSSVFKTAINQVMTEVPGEQVATILQDLNEWAVLNPNKPFANYLQERPSAAAQTLIATLVASGGQAAIAKSADRLANGSREQRSVDILTALRDGVVESKTFERAPERVRDFIAKHTANGAMENIFIPAEQLNQYFQSVNIPPELAAAEMGAKNYAEALATGGDVVIPLADFITSAAKTPHFDGLMQDIRFNQGEMTAREADLYAKNQPEDMRDIIESLATPQTGSPAIATMQQDIVGQLIASGLERSTAETYANLYARTMGNLSERGGLDPLALHERYGLQVIRPMADILTRLGDSDIQIDPLLDRLRAGEVPTETDVNGQGLIDFLRSIGGINDAGGELRQMEVDTDKAPFMRNLAQITGRGVDEAAALAREAGYPVDDILDAIQQEIGGQPIYSSANANDDLQALRRDLNSLGEYLHSIGVDIHTATNTEIREAMVAAVGNVYDQGAIATETAPFKKWFGDSKVVDADGKPLIVYHGSPDARFVDEDGIFATMKDRMLKFGNTPESKRAAADERAFFFTSSKKVAETYADDSRAWDYQVAVPAVIPTYVSIKNPLEVDAAGKHWREAQVSINKNDFVKQAKADGYDGVIIRNVRDSYDSLTTGKDPESDVFVAFESNQIKSATSNNGDFDPANPSILRQGTDKNRGYIQFGKDRKFNIALLENSDLSTFLHETGHFWLEVMGDLATDPTASEQLKSDYAGILKFLDVESREQIGIEQHELFARANEAYLREGKAPSAELRAMFQRFKAWLTMIYRSLTDLNVSLSDEVRGVFDRIYASDAEIEAAKHDLDLSALFVTAQEAGMTNEEFDAYRGSIEAATARAKEDLQAKLMRQFAREKLAWWNAERDKVKVQINDELDALPEYKAFDALTKGELPDGTPFKLDKSILIEQFGRAYIKRLPRGYGEGRGAVFATTGEGMYPDAAAELVGFTSGAELVESLINMRPRKALVEAEADKRMVDKHGDMMIDGTLADEAIESLHNDEQANILRLELQALRKKQIEVEPFVKVERNKAKSNSDFEARERAYERRWMEAEKNLVVEMERGISNERISELKAEIKQIKDEAREAKRAARAATETPPVSAFRNAARGLIGQTAVRDINPHAYLLAERKAGKAAFKAMAAGDAMEAAIQKQRELLNHYLYREATAAREATDEIYSYARKFLKGKARTKFGKAGATYLEQIDDLLDQYEFADVSKTDIVRREKLLNFISEKLENGESVQIPDSVLLDAERRNYKTLAFDQLLAVRDAIANIEHLVNLKTKLLTDKAKRELADVVAEGVESIVDNAKGEKRAPIGTRTWLDSAREMRDGYFVAHRKLSSLFGEMDGFKTEGFMWRTFMAPINEAGNRKAVLTEEATQKLSALYDLLRKPGIGNKIKGLGLLSKDYYPSLGMSMSKSDILSLALNYGNDGNRQRIRDGYNWTDQQVLAALDKLQPHEWQFVEGMWKLIDSYWPEISAQDKRVNGVAPEKVQASGFVLPSGRRIEGGYYPIKYDERHSVRSYTDRAKEEADRIMRGAVARPGVDTGFTEGRAGKIINRKIKLDLGVGLQHIDTVLQTLTHREVLIDLNKILGSSKLNGAILDYYGIETYKAISDAIVDVAAGEVGARDSVERSMSWLRSGVTVAAMGWKVSTALMQPLGFTQSTVKIGAKWMGRGISRYIGDALHMENATKFVYERSDMMRLRTKTQNREIAEIRNQISAGGLKSDIESTYFYMIVKMQAVVDIPTWLGAYERYMSETNNDEPRAIALADQAVIDAQGGGQVKDLASVQRGGPLKKMWTTFYSYFSSTWNLTVESAKRTDFRKVDDVGRFAVDMMLLYTIPTVLSGALKEAMGKGDDDDDEWYAWLAKEQLSYMTGTLIGVRELSGAIQGMFGYSGPAGARFFAEASKLVKQVGQGEADAAFIKAANNTAGILFHYPAGMLQNLVDGFIAMKEGKTQNPAALAFGAPRE